MRRNIAGLGLFLSIIAACTNAGEQISVPGYYTGALNMHFYIDINGNGVFDTDADQNMAGVKVAIFPGAFGTDTMSIVTTAENGNIHFAPLPLGTYHFSVIPSSVSNNVVLVSGDSGFVKVLARLDSLADYREYTYTYPVLTPAQAKSSPPGKTVAMRGKLVSPPAAFHDHYAFVSDGFSAIRIQAVTSQPTFAIGDSVFVFGATTTDLGQGILRDAVFYKIESKAPPIARVTTITEARTANPGALDASLVQINGKISDTVTVNGTFMVTVANTLVPTDLVTVVIDQQIEVVHSLYKPTFPIVVRGVLVPKGDGTWVVRARNATDVTFP